MIEFIGERIKTALESLPWITRPAGLVETVDTVDGEERRRYPWYKHLEGEGNMSPDAQTACLAFVDTQSEITFERTTARYRIAVARPRVVVWYDENQIEFDGDTFTLGGAMLAELTRAVEAATFAPLQNARVTVESIQTDPARIWSAYNFRADDALFMSPYRTFAVTFRLRAYEMKKAPCSSGTLEVVEQC
jgi:hypothetical protein